MKISRPRIKPAPSLRLLAKEFLKELADSEKSRAGLSKEKRETFWQPLWDSEKFVLKRQQTRRERCKALRTTSLPLSVLAIEYEAGRLDDLRE